MPEAHLTPPEACAFLRENFGVRRTPATLAKHRVTGEGPAFRKLNRAVLYSPTDLLAWASDALSVKRGSTSDLGRAS